MWYVTKKGGKPTHVAELYEDPIGWLDGFKRKKPIFSDDHRELIFVCIVGTECYEEYPTFKLKPNWQLENLSRIVPLGAEVPEHWKENVFKGKPDERHVHHVYGGVPC